MRRALAGAGACRGSASGMRCCGCCGARTWNSCRARLACGRDTCQKIIAFIALQRERLNAVLDAGFRRALAVSTLRRANGVQNVGLALYANAVSFEQLLALGTP